MTVLLLHSYRLALKESQPLHPCTVHAPKSYSNSKYVVPQRKCSPKERLIVCHHDLGVFGLSAAAAEHPIVNPTPAPVPATDTASAEGVGASVTFPMGEGACLLLLFVLELLRRREALEEVGLQNVPDLAVGILEHRPNRFRRQR